MPNHRIPLLLFRGSPVLLWVWTLLLVGASGCASSQWVTLREIPRNPLAQQLNLLDSSGPKASERTVQLLRRYDLHELQSGSPKVLLAKLQEVVDREPTAESVYSLAELAYIGAKKVEARDPEAAMDLYGAAVLNAYVYLFDPAFEKERNPYDPQYRGASNIYNTALESTLRIAQQADGLIPGCKHTIKTAGAHFDVTVVVRGTSWHEDDFKEFRFVSDYQMAGLTNHYYGYGLGVPLIAVRKKHEEGAVAAEQYYPPDLSFPVTAFLRIVRSSETTEDGRPKIEAHLELHDPLEGPDITVANRLVPLERDLSTPLAYFLSQPAFDGGKLSTQGLLNPEKVKALQGLYMLEPYQPGKIPVLMVHGLWSSPVTWMEMFNDLRSSPELRRQYQFWFYMYPTGQPFWISAAQMRADLAEARQKLDPQHTQPALDQMVLVGHSMGGLVSKLQVTESNDEFWQIVSDQPFDKVKADPETLAGLKKTLFFHPNPSIRRVVTVGTPHHGSSFANDLTRWLGNKLITLPQKLVLGRDDLIAKNPGLFNESTLLSINTSIDSLSPESPVFPVMLRSPTPKWVKLHTIIGQVPSGGFLSNDSEPSDSIVSVASARLPNAESEIIVPADHSNIHRHPRAILEIRRILLEHLADLRATPFQRRQRDGNIPVSGTY